MNNCEAFPDIFEEFAEARKIKDVEQIYTNGSDLILVDDVRKWLDHIESKGENDE